MVICFFKFFSTFHLDYLRFVLQGAYCSFLFSRKKKGIKRSGRNSFWLQKPVLGTEFHGEIART